MKMENSENIHMIVFFDNEEIGSQIERGATSPLAKETIEIIINALIKENKTTINNTSWKRIILYYKKK